MLIAIVLLSFVFFAGSTLDIFSGVFSTANSYITNIIPLSTWIDREDSTWFHGWTVFYWAWWISWSPFVGMFIARVSKGRTVREFLIAVLVIPTLVTIVWMSTFGGSALDQTMNNIGALSDGITKVPLAMYQMLENLPLSAITSFLAVNLVLVFFITSSDSGSLVIDSITSGGKVDAPIPQRIFWATMEGLIAGSLLYIGGKEALDALQAGAISTGLPFTIILILMCISLYKGLNTEKKLYTQKYKKIQVKPKSFYQILTKKQAFIRQNNYFLRQIIKYFIELILRIIQMNKPLLIEIGVEELPAIPFLKELPNIEKKWAKILEENRLLCDFDFFYTPRRLVLWHREFQVKQEDSVEEMFGAPVKIAFKDAEPTPAALGFAKKCGVSVEELERKDQGKGEVLYYKKEVSGIEAKNLLNDMVNEFISSLDFGKSMRWASRTDSFIRPIRSLAILLGEEVVEAELFGVKSSNFSYAHRMVSYEPFTYDFAGDYFCKLDKNGVILYPDERRKRILEQMKEIESSNGVKIDIDEELLEEVVAITEYPTALFGIFDEEFFEFPQEVIVA
eukprot:TRINITY_DN7234_c0_g1_i1.p1 TRINITY_DN7234_c0_g1~~TRINITY_DN7234_c0_g1_i1.p1  ORF type:complete len:662 (-),score=5.16 TRINITY_DN7234_c0_g1_i1:7-1698(-)